MKFSVRLVILVISMLVLAPLSLQAGPAYTIKDLGVAGTVGIGARMVPLQSAALNNAGGYTYTLSGENGQFHSLYDDGTGPVDIGSLNGGFTVARAINDAGTITGHSDSFSLDGQNNAFVYQAGQMTNIHTLGFGASSEAWDINSSGIVVGEFRGGFGFPTPGSGAFIYNPELGSMQNLHDVLPVITAAGSWSLRRANAINDAGQIVGYGLFRDMLAPPFPSPFPSLLPSGGVQRGFFYDGVEVINIGTLDGGFVSMAVDINEAGIVVGHSGRADGSIRAVKYHDSELVELGTLTIKKENGSSFAFAINNFNQIVGEVEFAETSRAFIYDDEQGMQDLNSLIKPGMGWDYLASAWDINDAGQVIGIGYIDGIPHVYLLSPSDFSSVPCQRSEQACEAIQSRASR